MEYGISGVRTTDLTYPNRTIVELDYQSVDLMRDGTESKVYLLGIKENDQQIKELTLVIELSPEQDKLYYEIPTPNPLEAHLYIEDFNLDGKKDIGVQVSGTKQYFYLFFNQEERFCLGWSSDKLTDSIQVPTRESQRIVTELEREIWEYVRGVYPGLRSTKLDLVQAHHITYQLPNLVIRQNIIASIERYLLGELETLISFDNENLSISHKIIKK